MQYYFVLSLLAYFFYSCTATIPKTDDLAQPQITLNNPEAVAEAWQKQLKIYNYKDSFQRFDLPDSFNAKNKYYFSFSAMQPIYYGLDSLMYARFYPRFSKMPVYLYLLKHEQQLYLYPNLDIFDCFFWAYADINNAKKNLSLFNFTTLDISSKVKNTGCKVVENKPQNDYNTQYYAAARNDTGYIFEATHLSQFAQLNAFFSDNSYFHFDNNWPRLDTFLLFLQNENLNNTELNLDKNTIPITYSSLFFSPATSFVDSQKLMMSGANFQQNKVYYFDNICLDSSSNAADKNKSYYYTGFSPEIDSLFILKQYLKSNKPNFLYYKKAAGIEDWTFWYNYFIAFYIDIRGGQPYIKKVDIICPQRVYYYRCYPAGICDDVGTNILDMISFKHKKSWPK